jgi:hypothetical protein
MFKFEIYIQKYAYFGSIQIQKTNFGKKSISITVQILKKILIKIYSIFCKKILDFSLKENKKMFIF